MLSGSGAVGDGGLETWQKDFGPKSSVPESFTFFPALAYCLFIHIRKGPSLNDDLVMEAGMIE